MSDANETNEVQVKKTGALGTSEVPPADPPPEHVTLEVGTGPGKQRLLLKFYGAQLLVGRGDDDETEIEIDMVPFSAFENGVSRRHAAFLRRFDGVYVEDLGSTNGTRINGFTLAPNKAYRLRNNDEIEFGRLRTVIRFKG